MNKPVKKIHGDTITLSHGSGGKAMRDLIEGLFVSEFDSPELNTLEDQARFSMDSLSRIGGQLAMTTDSYVVQPQRSAVNNLRAQNPSSILR